MFEQEHPLQSRTLDAVAKNELQHVLIPACELGIERYQEFRAANPLWRPRLLSHASGDEGSSSFCEGCRRCLPPTKPSNPKPQLTVECTGLSKVAKPISISVSKPGYHAKMPMAENIASLHGIHSPVVIKATQQYANKGTVLEETGMVKPPLVKSASRKVLSIEHVEETMKSNEGEDYAEDAVQLEREKAVQPLMSEHATSSEDLSEDVIVPSQMETMSVSDNAMGASQGDKPSKHLGTSSTDDPILVSDEDLFSYVLATRQIPYGHSFSSLDISMQRRLHNYFKQYSPPCPHCNCNTYVKFRYFNNSGKSSLLQPRFSCRNPDTCLTIQEKNGKAGSRDFTLPKPKEVENSKALPEFLTHEHLLTCLRPKPNRQPQMIPQVVTKRPAAHDLTSLAEAGERSAKLPNTTLSLQMLNGPHEVEGLQIVEASKARALQSVKHADDSNSSSSTLAPSEERTAINVRCRADATSETGRLVVQPISVQTVASTSGKAELSIGERPRGGKIAELNICMYIDLSTAT